MNQPLIRLLRSLKDRSSKVNYTFNKLLWDVQDKKMQNMTKITFKVGRRNKNVGWLELV